MLQKHACYKPGMGQTNVWSSCDSKSDALVLSSAPKLPVPRDFLPALGHLLLSSSGAAGSVL